MMSRPVVSIVIPTYQRPSALARCLDSIEGTVELAHEVICVVVAGDRPTTEALEARSAQVLIQPARGGAVQAMNMGLRAAQGEYVAILNDDCEVLPHSIANAVRFLEAPPHKHVGQAAFFHDSPLPDGRNVHSQINVTGRWFHVCHVRGLCYANFGLASRSLYEKLGYLDDRYFMYGADPDFSLKVWHQAKLAVEPCPGAMIQHHELADDRAVIERARQHEDNAKLFAKWRLDGTNATERGH